MNNQEIPYQKWSEIFDERVVSENIGLGFLPETKQFLYDQGLSPAEALERAKIIASKIGVPYSNSSCDEAGLPYDEGAAITKGKRVRKIFMREGDLTDMHSTGITVGYKRIEDYKLYFIVWDGFPDIVNGVAADSLEEII
jgi:hypothetical protein